MAMGIDAVELFDPSMRGGKVRQRKLHQIANHIEALSESELDWAFDMIMIALKTTGKAAPLILSEKVKQTKA